MKDMLSKYVNNTSFEGHERFLKMLYLVEANVQRIDLTLKPSN
jgi:hypothetical protein